MRITRMLVILLLGMGAVSASAQVLNIDPPGERDFILDTAYLINEEDQAQIKQVCDTLLTERATPIVVVTVNSMDAHGAGDMRIETFATLLFNQWGIGYEKVGKQDWNTGILLLISAGDRKARIELGALWGRDHDAVAQRIMDEQIIPNFKKGDYTGGITAGVVALDKMARGLALPKRVRPWWHYALMIAIPALGIFTAVSLIRRGASGWAWLFWGVVFSILGVLLYQMLTNRGRSGGFGGGSFGGGFSGGGGASGSW